MVTAILDHATLTQVDTKTRLELEAAADAYEKAGQAFEKASEGLHAAILDAADRERPADIARAIRHTYTYDYVARLIRHSRGPGKPGRPPRQS